MLRFYGISYPNPFNAKTPRSIDNCFRVNAMLCFPILSFLKSMQLPSHVPRLPQFTNSFASIPSLLTHSFTDRTNRRTPIPLCLIHTHHFILGGIINEFNLLLIRIVPLIPLHSIFILQRIRIMLADKRRPVALDIRDVCAIG
jgi:hypothetical protein